MKILVADDVSSNRMAISLMLSSRGTPDEVSSGQEALDRIRAAWKSGTPYDFICLDFLMLDMTGAEVLLQIRQEEEALGIDRPVKILCATSVDDRTQLAVFQNDPDATYLEKPLSTMQLQYALHKLKVV